MLHHSRIGAWLSVALLAGLAGLGYGECRRRSAGAGRATAQNRKSKLQASDIRALATGFGACLATDRITVEGFPVRFMYRQKQDRDYDSGWRFFSGIHEEDAYVNNPDNVHVFDVNTIANYDPSIVPFLNSPIGSVFERAPDGGKWLPVRDFKIPE
jgi:hypothetical protein